MFLYIFEISIFSNINVIRIHPIHMLRNTGSRHLCHFMAKTSFLYAFKQSIPV